MKPKVYIDGKDGTTGLQIYDRLAKRNDIDLLLIDEAKRKDTEERRKLMHAADLVFLCLPDGAAVEAVTLADNPDTRIIDASTAHRTAPGWTYGFPELSKAHRDAIRNSRRVANPGCHATGFISVVYPLIAAGVLPKDAALSCFSLTGYSGGGKKMIAEYEAADRDPILDSPALYGVGQAHKHLPEMQRVCGLSVPPVFCPIVDDYYKGMATTVPFHTLQLADVSSPEDLRRVYAAHYAGSPVVSVLDGDAPARIHAGALSGRDQLEIVAAGNGERVTVTALFDNLGKGASGAAVQNMNLMLGFDETAGLNLE
ncbi:MAG: N-acetyl-gamma-glutamyl-phosphate reductase [Oscillibacter sp.]|nr:N-acetyl-gamma-glutamyl-phosphate reductase [Oscillibacter sp.]